ncbi:hypothetical protein [Streptomyces globosus]|uniref:hypothetical protein n=1 Tax=Streptomyces globosus TaxID=68209 RepID=UPI0031D31D03
MSHHGAINSDTTDTIRQTLGLNHSSGPADLRKFAFQAILAIVSAAVDEVVFGEFHADEEYSIRARERISAAPSRFTR